MISVELNPAGIKPDYLAGLNRCFDHWGGEERFKWAVRRAFEGQLPDLLVVREEGRLVAGSGIIYRNVRIGKTKQVRVAIMSGSWTLPEARRRGHFERMIEMSQQYAAERGATRLLAFVTEQNPSYRRLVSAGAAQWETHYLQIAAEAIGSRYDSVPSVQPIADETRMMKRILDQAEDIPDETARFVYCADDWAAQYLHRPNRTESLALNDDGIAVIEKTKETDSILYLSCPGDASFMNTLSALYLYAAARGHTLMFFTSSVQQAMDAIALGMKRIPGYLMALPTTHALHAGNPSEWNVQSGDRM